jgi:hypothetical protein
LADAREQHRRFARVVALAVAVVVLLIPAAALPSTAPSAHLTAVAKHLNNPRKLFVTPEGALYVVEAGTGGRDKCLGTGPTKVCIGLTGSISRIARGVKRRVVTGLWSGARLDGSQAQGPADVVVRGDTYYVLLQNGGITPRGFNALGPDGATAGDLISTPPGKVSPAVIVNLAAFEADRNPDRGAGPGANLGSPPIDSNPYALAPYRGGFAIVDAGGNDVLWVDSNGRVSVLAVFPTRRAKLTRGQAKQIGRPSARSITAQSVPSSVAVGPDGALYVGELTGWPFERGTARVWRVAPDGEKRVYASGFTNISDLVFDGRDLLVLEMAVDGLLVDGSPGRVTRLAPDGKRVVLARDGLVSPTGIAVADGSIYVSNHGVSPGSGKEPRGEVVRFAARPGS